MIIFLGKKTTKIVSVITLFLIVVAGVLSTVYAGEKMREKDLHDLLLRAKNIALLIDGTKVQSLDGAITDLDKKEYQNIKTQMIDIHELNVDTRFIYLMGQKSEQQFFYVDSEDPASEDYSAPGEVYTFATPLDIFNYTNTVSYVDGPFTDAWGSLISVRAPIINPETNTIVAMLGMDIDAHDFTAHVFAARRDMALIFLLVFICVLLFVLLNNKTVKYAEELEDNNEDLQENKDYLLEAEHLAKLGQFTWSASTGLVVMNNMMLDLLHLNTNEMSLDSLTKYVHPDDLKNIKKQFSSMNNYTFSANFKYRITDSEYKNHSFVSVCKIKRDPKGDIVRVTCTAQDVTENL